MFEILLGIAIGVVLMTFLLINYVQLTIENLDFAKNYYSFKRSSPFVQVDDEKVERWEQKYVTLFADPPENE
ncbi:hypothetical protein [Selenihalanaerobacter shriftii]|uniref:Uncharacterized protein n=1 Tax=Selenihalanaerobacter shriftii TaxID=142842 RepID=A0A1T4N6T3_9FIRM|nr:hypothetical protein [Selenihalanaerobacter shriftii]SJZ74883.1 hypothetical protein SAMN02745118_01716 [Selenihalanaerobacter shriftii]